MATPPASVSSIVRSSSTVKLKVIVGRRVPTQENPSIYDFKEKDVTVGQRSATRRMSQKNNTSIFFEFTYPPTQITYEGFGMDIQEIPRPLLKPLIDIKAKFNYKASFEFLVAASGDGLTESVESQLRTLEWMAALAEPVAFENFDTFLNTGYWYIAQFAIKSSRVNTSGQIVAAQCTIGLLEYTDANIQFAKFPKINYKNSNRAKSGAATNASASDPLTAAQQLAYNALVVAGQSTVSPGAGGQVGSSFVKPSATPKKIYRYTYRAQKRWGEDVPPPKTTSGEQIFTKEGNAWVLYSVASAFPYEAYEIEAARWNRGRISEPELNIVNDLKTEQRKAYEASLRIQDLNPAG